MIYELNSFIHSGYFYSDSSSPLLLRGAPDTARILCRSLSLKRHRQLRVKDLQKSPYVAARAGFEPKTLHSTGIDSTNEPPSLTPFHRICVVCPMEIRHKLSETGHSAGGFH